jgi:hypothetical protein
MDLCKNCDATLDGPYCPACGQRDVDLERPFLELASEILKETVDVDGRAWRTIKTLFAQPGRLTSEFLAGKRKTYTPPLRLYIFISVSFFIVMAWVASRGLLLDQAQTLETDAARQANFMSDELPRLMFLLMPVFALILKAFFRERLYFDHLIFAVHLHSAAYVILGIMLPFEGLANESVLAAILQVSLLIYFVAYFLIALRRVYATTSLGTAARAFAILFAYMIVVSGLIEATSSFLLISD